MTEMLAALAHLPDGAMVTVSVPVGELRAALEATGGGPKVLTTHGASKFLGYSVDFWADAARQGKVEGAYRLHRNGPWRLPRAGCEAHLRGLQQRGRAQSTRRSRAVIPFDGSRARGPRKASTA